MRSARASETNLVALDLLSWVDGPIREIHIPSVGTKWRRLDAGMHANRHALFKQPDGWCVINGLLQRSCPKPAHATAIKRSKCAVDQRIECRIHVRLIVRPA